MKISEIIADKYKLRIPPTVYYDLLADVKEAEEEQAPCDKYIKEIEHLRKYIYKLETQIVEQEPTTKNDLGVDCISRADAIRVASGYCHPSNVAKELAKLPSVTPQEPKPMVEIDLDYVIKQKYIEREVLDKIRAEISDYQKEAYYSDDIVMTKRMVLAIIDKYKAESEDKE